MNRCCSLVVILAIVGCSGASGTVPVQGVVRLDGKPLPGASVQFIPEAGGRDATATADEQGRFVLSTFDARDGALPGTYKVVIVPSTPILETPKGLSADEAMAAGSAAAERPQPKPTGPTVPEQYTRADQTPLKQVVPAQGDVVFDLKSK